MRLTCIEPHSRDREDGYERHVYRCAECANVSRFVFEAAPGGKRPRRLLRRPSSKKALMPIAADADDLELAVRHALTVCPFHPEIAGR